MTEGIADEEVEWYHQNIDVKKIDEVKLGVMQIL
jgi:hypothetical protein